MCMRVAACLAPLDAWLDSFLGGYDRCGKCMEMGMAKRLYVSTRAEANTFSSTLEFWTPSFGDPR